MRLGEYLSLLVRRCDEDKAAEEAWLEPLRAFLEIPPGEGDGVTAAAPPAAGDDGTTTPPRPGEY